MKNYYKILGVEPTATEAQIKQVYRQKAKALHPDLNKDNPNAASQLADVNEAYDVLSDATKRAEYDKQYNASMARRAAAQNAQNMGAGGPGFGYRNAPPQFNANPYAQFRAAGGPSRIDLAAQAMAAQAAAAAQRQQQIQIDNAMKQSYNNGYSKGFADANETAAKWEKKYRTETTALNNKVRELEEKLALAESDMEAQTEQLAKMIEGSEIVDSKHAEEKKKASEIEQEFKALKREKEAIERRSDFYRREYETLKVNFEKVRVKVKETEDTLSEKSELLEKALGQIADLEEETLRLKTKIAEYEEFVQYIEADESIEKIMLERELKLKKDKKDFKNSMYGTLGVMFWADSDEIQLNYEKLCKRYGTKAENGDEKAQIKMAELKKAYETLSDAKKRAKYNASIDITEEQIEKERELEKTYNEMIENYNRSKEEQEFLAYLDDLVMLAQSGDDEAQNVLGEMYYYGEDIETDYEQAVYWFKEAAKQQNPAALYNLGVCFIEGYGVEYDETKGIGFIKQSAKLGYKPAVDFLK